MSEAEFEAAPAEVPWAPLKPTQRELDEHEASGHVTFRDWCPVCIRSRNLERRHYRQDPEEENAVPILASDFCFTSESEGGDGLVVLVSKDARTKMIWASAVSDKTASSHSVSHLGGVYRSSGHRRLIHMSDGEPAIVALKEHARAQTSGVEALFRESPVGDPQANGLAENAVREVKRIMKALRLCFEGRAGIELRDNHPMASWLPQHAGFVLSKFRLGADGKTAEQRRTGRSWRRPLVTFGERILFKPSMARNRKADKGASFEEGHFVGVLPRTSEVLVMTSKGVKKGATIQRLAEDQRWKVEGFDDLFGTPWQMLRPAVAVAADAIPAVDVRVAGPLALAPERRPQVAVPAAVPGGSGPRALYVRARDIEQFGSTPGCPGCSDLLTGRRTSQGTTRSHSQACRARVSELLSAQGESGRSRVEQARKRKEPERVESDTRIDPVEGEMDASEAMGAPQPLEGPSTEVATAIAEAAPGASSSSSSGGGMPISVGTKRRAEMPPEQLADAESEGTTLEEAAASRRIETEDMALGWFSSGKAARFRDLVDEVTHGCLRSGENQIGDGTIEGSLSSFVR